MECSLRLLGAQLWTPRDLGPLRVKQPVANLTWSERISYAFEPMSSRCLLISFHFFPNLVGDYFVGPVDDYAQSLMRCGPADSAFLTLGGEDVNVRLPKTPGGV